MVAWTSQASPLGPLLLIASDHGLAGVYFEQHKYFRGVDGKQDHGHPILKMAMGQLTDYFEGRLKRFDLPLDLRGTAFQLKIWKQLLSIPFGQPSTYSRVALEAACPEAVRAVGTAIGRNPVSIIVPCHRVLRTGGKLAGYAGGLERKRYLLALEERQ